MKCATPALGLTLVVTAVAVGFMSTSEQAPDAVDTPRISPSDPPLNSRPVRSSPGHRPPDSRHFDYGELPSGFSAAAEARMTDLTARLGLTPDQQEKIRPLVLRSTPGYPPDPISEDAHQGSLALSLGPRLTLREFDDLALGLLDEDQQLDQIAEAADRETWWREVIDRLEEDLHQQTDPGQSSADIPSSSEGQSLPSRHQRGNLLDLLENQSP